jgi:hypothetical protein
LKMPPLMSIRKVDILPIRQCLPDHIRLLT